MTQKVYERILDWLVPALLAILASAGFGMCGVLWNISDKLSDMNANMKVALFRQDQAESKIETAHRRVDESKVVFDQKVDGLSKRIDETNGRVANLERLQWGVQNP